MSKIIDSGRILEIFFDYPERDFHIREVSKLVKISPTTVSCYLDSMRKEGLLECKKERGYFLFRANADNMNFKEEKKHHNIIRLINSGILDFLNKELNYPSAIILFGSFSKGENIKGSDIDLFVLSDCKKELDLSHFEKKLGSSIQIFVYGRKDFESLKLNSKELLNSIINGTVMSGFIEVF